MESVIVLCRIVTTRLVKHRTHNFCIIGILTATYLIFSLCFIQFIMYLYNYLSLIVLPCIMILCITTQHNH